MSVPAKKPRHLPEEGATVPMRRVGPVVVKGTAEGAFMVPLATFETPLWPSVERGARVCEKAGGIQVVCTGRRMTRSVALELPDVAGAFSLGEKLRAGVPSLQKVVSKTSRYAKLLEVMPLVVGRLLYLRFAFTTGEAGGHNMVTKASDALLTHIMQQCPDVRYVSISANICTDKKVSAANTLLGRGASMVAEVTISAALCRKMLKTEPAKLVELHVKKNLLGSIMAGSLMSANAHVANMLLAFYLATGQDGANVVEGSQAVVHAEATGTGDLYFSLTLPNLIVGTLGNGKDLPCVPTIRFGRHARQVLAVGCRKPRSAGMRGPRRRGRKKRKTGGDRRRHLPCGRTFAAGSANQPRRTGRCAYAA